MSLLVNKAKLESDIGEFKTKCIFYVIKEENIMSCNTIIKTTSVAVEGEHLRLVATTENALVNLKNYSFVICQTVPSVETPIPVILVLNGTIYPMLTNSGNKVKSNQIRSRRKYCMVYGKDTPHFLIHDCLRVCNG